MPRPKVKFDSAGVLAMLQSAGIRKAVSDAAKRVAAGASIAAHDGAVEVVVDETTTDRAKAFVTLAHPAGLGLEAKHGVLTKAARAAGLEMSGEAPTDLVDYRTKAGKTRKATRAQVANWTRGSSK
jgi:hypothetical protein